MKTLARSLVGFGKSVAAFVVLSSLFSACIYDGPRNDRFYRTLWSSEEEPFDKLTLEFMCDGYVLVSSQGAVGSYGDYQADGNCAHFRSLRLTFDRSTSIIIEDGYRCDDSLMIRWHFADSNDSRLTMMTRRSEY